MCRDLEHGYIASCPDCQHNKSTTNKPYGLLHPLFQIKGGIQLLLTLLVHSLPDDEGKNSIVTFTDRLGSDIQIVATHTDITAGELAYLFFDKWYCENVLPLNIMSDRDKLFVS